MKVYRVTLLVVDHDGVGDEIPEAIENARYPNRCLSPLVVNMESVDIGEWHDESPFNYRDKMNDAFNSLISKGA